MDFSNLTVLVTGGTGSFGKAFTRWMIDKCRPKKIIIFSRDELKQSEMAKEFHYEGLRYFIGDVRDRDRLFRAFKGVDVVVHAAALKQVPTLEYNPFEAVLTNVIGAENIISAALDQGVKKVVALSTDKAVNPVNLYGATKLCAEKLFSAASAYSGLEGTRFCTVRYGNVIGSRGSVIPLFKAQRQTGTITITHPEMSRFWLTLDQAIELVLKALDETQGSEIFVPKVPTMTLMDLAESIAPGCEQKIIGIRPGEKLHEVLITEDEGHRTYDAGSHYVIYPAFEFQVHVIPKHFKRLPDQFRYSSDNPANRMTIEELRAIVNEKSESIVTETV
ncbi:MAG: UDP-N-acetylglucosamine 4,6-dehydratase (inverting) [Candidatus Omnitrophica bacterium CG11_big_fil_rev_8_21_14_0_20_45_26]|uniref:UDP-N-acetylglucosamine 4,6-dehydratase (Inverting) n=1 Tax=Candidatus Abzuiibacterium crystallinum TaxID=1974748 RepID=A0A2H0LLB7_9BACT|nr:MAG: UDP-N-acetylglucosamine 4,6-dehydratase (inverting) [Candidatus Omnitrophica bacterium CG11_big_fil_rev_8_21_14_0_20_45_26]PIW65396.1 MAG: UDP-N-acetylglucosamine 4,6-dehydratase (inverting) [Candidatus Omnitrophica bacterium CG12_big_fil_rev_8_21_14_0_65_45_16]